MRVIRYLFPALRLREKLPLLPREWSSDLARWKHEPGEIKEELQILKIAGVARTDQDALRLLKRHPYKSAHQIAVMTKRKRKRKPRIVRAWERFKRLW